MEYPKIAIVILHWKHVSDTIHCLESVKKCNYQNFQIVLLLNGASHDDQITLENTVGKWPEVHILKEKNNTGFAEGNNIAIRYTLNNIKPEYILTLNNDTEVTPDFIEEALAKAMTGIDMVQCLMYEFGDRKQIDKAGIRLSKSLLPFDIKDLDKNYPLFCPSAGAALYSRKLLEAVALDRQITDGFSSIIVKDYFDSDYFAYAEDLDLGFRARLMGFDAALARQSIVYHRGSASTGTMSDFAIYHTYRNLIWTLQKNISLFWKLHFGLYFLIGQVAIFLKNLSRRQHKQITKAWKNAKLEKTINLAKRDIILDKATHKLSDKLISKSLF